MTLPKLWTHPAGFLLKSPLFFSFLPSSLFLRSKSLSAPFLQALFSHPAWALLEGATWHSEQKDFPGLSETFQSSFLSPTHTSGALVKSHQRWDPCPCVRPPPHRISICLCNFMPFKTRTPQVFQGPGICSIHLRKQKISRQNLCTVMYPKSAKKIGLKKDRSTFHMAMWKNTISSLQVQETFINKLLKGLLTKNLT